MYRFIHVTDGVFLCFTFPYEIQLKHPLMRCLSLPAIYDVVLVVSEVPEATVERAAFCFVHVGKERSTRSKVDHLWWPRGVRRAMKPLGLFRDSSRCNGLAWETGSLPERCHCWLVRMSEKMLAGQNDRNILISLHCLYAPQSSLSNELRRSFRKGKMSSLLMNTVRWHRFLHTWR